MNVVTALFCESIPSRGYWKGYAVYVSLVSLCFFVPLFFQMGAFSRYVADSTFLVLLALALPVAPLRWWVGACYGIIAVGIATVFHWVAEQMFSLGGAADLGAFGMMSMAALFVLSILAGTQQARFLYPEFFRFRSDEHFGNLQD